MTSGLVGPSIGMGDSGDDLEFEDMEDPLEINLSGNDVPEDVNMTNAEVSVYLLQ